MYSMDLKVRIFEACQAGIPQPGSPEIFCKSGVSFQDDETIACNIGALNRPAKVLLIIMT